MNKEEKTNFIPSTESGKILYIEISNMDIAIKIKKLENAFDIIDCLFFWIKMNAITICSREPINAPSPINKINVSIAIMPSSLKLFQRFLLYPFLIFVIKHCIYLILKS